MPTDVNSLMAQATMFADQLVTHTPADMRATFLRLISERLELRRHPEVARWFRLASTEFQPESPSLRGASFFWGEEPPR